jgi:7 transmembrane helices usually fused to an inactive transglutaminase/Inactive transglutaminase fused to 7 transmembrane helices
MKSNKRHVYSLILILLAVGFTIFTYRHFILDVPLTETENVNSWVIEANLHFVANKNMPVKANFMIPYMPPHFVILDEYFVTQNYGVTTDLDDFNRRAIWSLRRSSGKPQSLYYRAIVREADIKNNMLAKPGYINPPPLTETKQAAVDTIINDARQASVDIQTFAQRTIQELNKPNGNNKLLIGDIDTETSITKAIITVLTQAKIATMPVQGLVMSKQGKAEFHTYLAIFNEKEWFYCNPINGVIGLPSNILIWSYGDKAMFHVSGGKSAQFNISISPTPINALSAAKKHGAQINSNLMRFSLLQLPVDVQQTYKILLTIPLGTFIILILRNFIGLATFGTFMPVLIALAFRETHVLWGISLFTIIISFGLAARFYLDQLKLLLIPRLAAILTVVILLMIFISILCQNLNLESGLSVALFPMVILTMTIERMCITWDERGAFKAIKSGVGSLLAAVLCYTIMNYSPLQYLVFAFPELLLVFLALIIWFGQYKGYRVSELIRFKALGKY